MTEQSNVINIDGKEYKQEDLSVEQIRLVSKIAKYQKQSNDLKDAFEDANILQQQYLQSLKTSLGNAETTKAMEKASEVKAQIDTHEAVCAERWKETILRIKRIEHILIGTAGTMLLFMASIILK